MPRISTRILRIGVDPLPERGLAIVPANARAVEELQSFYEDKGKLATTVLPHEKVDSLRDWYWGVLQESADGLGILKDDLHVNLKVDVRFFRNIALTSMGPVPILRSISRGITLTDLRQYVNASIFGGALDAYIGDRQAVLAAVEKKYGPRPI